MKKYILIFSIVCSSFILAVQSGDSDQIVGVWKSSNNDLMIKIDKVGDQFQGRIVWLNATNNGQPALDEKNPEERLQKMPLKGNKIIRELSFDASNSVWDNGIYYNYKEGKLYNCRIIMQSNGQINIIRYDKNRQDSAIETWNRQ